VARPLRLRILDYLQNQGSARTASQIASAAGAGQALVSQQLRILKDSGVLIARREGSYLFYGIADPSILLILDGIRSHGARTG
jgi:DNA-binding transcriptional ArsR family regulator